MIERRINRVVLGALSYAVSYNAFDVLYTGTRNDFSGRVGYTFRAEQTFDIHGLMRSSYLRFLAKTFWPL
jgi:hypothetical protein